MQFSEKGGNVTGKEIYQNFFFKRVKFYSANLKEGVKFKEKGGEFKK